MQNINAQKIILANEATSMLHGEKEAKASEETAKKTFSENSLGSGLPSILLKKKKLIIKLTLLI